MKKSYLLIALGALMALGGCGGGGEDASSGSAGTGGTGGGGSTSNVEGFTYDTQNWTPSYGTGTNEEAYDYDDLIVNPVTNALRSDFAYGVDASMIAAVEAEGAKFYNEDGQEQDIFQILAAKGVNFFRVRLWNKPSDRYGRTYGGGGNDYATDLAMIKRARAVGMNVCVDFHYSDFWADPDKQQLPKDWQSSRKADIPGLVYEFTKETLEDFQSEGVRIDAVQIGNEINNGMAGDYGAIDWADMDGSFAYIADILKEGIRGTKEVFPNCATIIHLANGTNADEFSTYFGYLDDLGVNYDIIGASYYPALTGDLSRLQANLDRISNETGKPVMVVETSWGYTDEYNPATANQYSADDEDTGGYLTSVQAQATALRDVLDVISKVPNQKGLGCFYWEPAWVPAYTEDAEGNISTAGWATARGQSYADRGVDNYASNYTDGLCTWSNQGWFSYTGKILPSASVYEAVKAGGMNATTEVSESARATEYSAVLNLAADETLPATGKVVTNLDAIRDRAVVWNETEAAQCVAVGTYTVHGRLDEKYDVTLTVECIENFVVDPGFENQGETDIIKDPWAIRSQTPADAKVVRLDRKSDTRTGTTDMNWYYSAGDYSFDVYQTITGIAAGTYELTTWLLAPAQSDFAQTLTLYIVINGTENTLDISNKCVGWSAGYQECSIENIAIPEGATVEIGLKGSCASRAWGHNDDWTLVRA